MFSISLAQIVYTYFKNYFSLRPHIYHDFLTCDLGLSFHVSPYIQVLVISETTWCSMPVNLLAYKYFTDIKHTHSIHIFHFEHFHTRTTIHMCIKYMHVELINCLLVFRLLHSTLPFILFYLILFASALFSLASFSKKIFPTFSCIPPSCFTSRENLFWV